MRQLAAYKKVLVPKTMAYIHIEGRVYLRFSKTTLVLFTTLITFDCPTPRDIDI
jgi:hypothetical protein